MNQEKHNSEFMQYVRSQFNHFSKVTGYATEVSFNFDEDFDYMSINAKVAGLDLRDSKRKRHYKRLDSLYKKIRKRCPSCCLGITNTRPKPLTPEQQQFRDATFHNRESIEKSTMCGCYYCRQIFPASEIKADNYIDGGTTACCPYCDMDSVYGDASGIPLTPEKLKKLSRRWFGDD